MKDQDRIVDGGHITLKHGDDGTLRMTLFADPETWLWIELDDQEVESLITQLVAWRNYRIIGTPQ